MNKLICFDFDGVLVDTFDLQLEVLQAVQKKFSQGRYPNANDLKTVKDMSYRSFAAHIELPETIHAEFERNVKDLLERETRPVRIFPGIPEMLTQISSGNVLCVITSNIEREVTRVLKEAGVDHLIAAIYDSDLGGTKKERLERACREFSIESGNTYMVGDSMSDIRHGHAANAKTVAIGWGYQPRELLLGENPHYFADTVAELAALFL